MCVSEIRVNQIRVNQGLGVHDTTIFDSLCTLDPNNNNTIFCGVMIFRGFNVSSYDLIFDK